MKVKAHFYGILIPTTNMYFNFITGPKVIKLFFMLNSTEHGISTAHKNLNAEK